MTEKQVIIPVKVNIKRCYGELRTSPTREVSREEFVSANIQIPENVKKAFDQNHQVFVTEGGGNYLFVKPE